MDMFSQLPQHLVHRILNLLPTTEAARTSVLSMSWKSAWDSHSTVDVDLKKFKGDTDKFLEFTRKALERYIQQGLGVEGLTIFWNTVVLDYDRRILASMRQWIDFALAAGNNLKQLVISGEFCYQKGGISFHLNLRASNTLTTLNLYKCKLVDEDISEKIKFPSLQNLSLIRTALTSDIVHKTFLSGSPFLKSLILDACVGLRGLEVSGLVRITSISVNNCRSLNRVDIQAPNLQDFSFSTNLGLMISRQCEIKLAACEESLKELKLARIKLPTDDKYWLQTTVSRFVCLEILYLCNLYDPNKEGLRISKPSRPKEISHQKLRKLRPRNRN